MGLAGSSITLSFSYLSYTYVALRKLKIRRGPLGRSRNVREIIVVPWSVSIVSQRNSKRILVLPIFHKEDLDKEKIDALMRLAEQRLRK
jgi:hypothetical protein